MIEGLFIFVCGAVVGFFFAAWVVTPPRPTGDTRMHDAVAEGLIRATQLDAVPRGTFSLAVSRGLSDLETRRLVPPGTYAACHEVGDRALKANVRLSSRKPLDC